MLLKIRSRFKAFLILLIYPITGSSSNTCSLPKRLCLFCTSKNCQICQIILSSSILCSPCTSVHVTTVIAHVSTHQLFLPTLGRSLITCQLFMSEMFVSRMNFISYPQIFLSKYQIEQTIYVIVPGQLSPHWSSCGNKLEVSGFDSTFHFAKVNQM